MRKEGGCQWTVVLRVCLLHAVVVTVPGAGSWGPGAHGTHRHQAGDSHAKGESPACHPSRQGVAVLSVMVMEMAVMMMEMAVMVMEMHGSHDDGDGSHDVFLLCGWITLAIRMTVLSVMMLEVAICQSCWWRWQSVNHADGGGSHVNVVVFRCGWTARLQTVQTADLPCFLC